MTQLADLIQPLQGLIHQILACSDLCRSYLRVGTIASLGGPFDRREILVVAVAVAKKEESLETSSLSEPHRMLTEELSASPDKTDLFVEHRDG